MTAARILLLRSGIEEGAEAPSAGVDVLLTHEVVPAPGGIAEAIAFDPDGAAVVVTSRSAILVLEAARPGFFARFSHAYAAGMSTARALSRAGAPAVEVGSEPGAAGLVPLLAARSAPLLWPHGSDADPEPFEPLAAGRPRWASPVVYEKLPSARPDPILIGAFLDGRYAGVAASSLAALDVLLAAVRESGRTLPQVRWGAIGPGTARAFASRNLSAPVVPARARIGDLIEAVMRDVAGTGASLRKERK